MELPRMLEWDSCLEVPVSSSSVRGCSWRAIGPRVILHPLDRMSEIFISYIHEDHAVATGLAGFLGHHGYKDVFFTGNDWLLYAGEVWLARIRQELTAAKVVLSLFSPASVTRPWVHFEAGAAWLTDKVLIPVCIRGFTIDDLRIPYSGIQAITLTDSGSAYYLLRSLSKHLRPDTTAPPPFAQSDEGWRILESKLNAES